MSRRLYLQLQADAWARNFSQSDAADNLREHIALEDLEIPQWPCSNRYISHQAFGNSSLWL